MSDDTKPDTNVKAARADENAVAETDRAEQHLRAAAAWRSVAAVCRAVWPPKEER